RSCSCGFQLEPPSVVRRITIELSPPPTAVPVLESVKHTPTRSIFVPLNCVRQWSPPSVVRRIVPPKPTTVPVFLLTKCTLTSAAAVPLFCVTQPGGRGGTIGSEPQPTTADTNAQVASSRGFGCTSLSK